MKKLSNNLDIFFSLLFVSLTYLLLLSKDMLFFFFQTYTDIYMTVIGFVGRDEGKRSY